MKINIEELLVKRNSSGATPLHIAAKNGFSALVGQLLETCPLAIEVHDSKGLTPFTLTAALGRVKVKYFKNNQKIFLVDFKFLNFRLFKK